MGSIFLTIKHIYQVDCLSPFCLVLFLRFCLASIGTYSFVSLFCLIFCVCFYVLGKSATSPSLEVALCRKCPVGLRSAIPPDHQSHVLKGCHLHELRVPSCCDRATAAAAMYWWAWLTPGTTMGPTPAVVGCWGGTCPQNGCTAQPLWLSDAGGQGFHQVCCEVRQ